MGKNWFNLNIKKKSLRKSSKSSPESSIVVSDSPPPSVSSPSVLRINDSGDLRQVFDRFDANGDGKISISELESMLLSLGNDRAAEEAESIMRTVDLDGDGFISLEEFISVNKKDTNSAVCLEDLRNAFTVFDKDKNGLISAEELHHVLRGMGEKTSLADCKSMIKGIDQNGDGAVNFEEFIQMMTTRSIA